MIKLTSEQVVKLRFVNHNIQKNKLELEEGDKVYIFTNSTLPKLKVREYIKSKGAKQVHKISEANKFIVKNETCSGFDTKPYGKNIIEVRNMHELADRDYIASYMTNETKEILDLSKFKDRPLTETELREVLDLLYRDPSNGRLSPNGWYDREYFMLDSEITSSYYAVASTMKSDLNEVFDLLTTNIENVYFEDEIQQFFYNWEVSTGRREDVQEYSWESLKSLLISDEGSNHELAIEIMKNLNLKDVLSELLIFFSVKAGYELQKKINKHLFKVNPKIIKVIGKRYYEWNCSLNELSKRLKDLDASHSLTPLFDYDIIPNVTMDGSITQMYI